MANAGELALHGAELRELSPFDTGDPQQGVVLRTMRHASGSRRGFDEVMSHILVKSGEDVSALALSADGRTAVTDDGGSMSVWDLSGVGTDPLRTVCTDPRFEVRLHRPLTQDTWPPSFGDLDDFRPCP